MEKSHFPEDKIVFLQREIDITRKVDHENIIKCYDVYEDRNYIHFVFDIVEESEKMSHKFDGIKTNKPKAKFQKKKIISIQSSLNR